MENETVAVVSADFFERNEFANGCELYGTARMSLWLQAHSQPARRTPALESDETKLQLVCYVVVEDTNGRVLRYRRGKKGSEDRLHGDYSIGVGGHIRYGESLEDAVRREVEEELGIKLMRIDTAPIRGKEMLILDRSNPVGRVHLGLVAKATIYASHIELEESVLVDPQWIWDDELTEDGMENWSKILLLEMRRAK